MTNIITEKQIAARLDMLQEITELDLTVDHNASGYTLYLMQKDRVLDILGFRVSLRGIYEILLGAYNMISAMHRCVLVHR
ncbi:MAG: hypothetical protein WA941_09470 [Nitrososphaeraceae archaeon]